MSSTCLLYTSHELENQVTNKDKMVLTVAQAGSETGVAESLAITTVTLGEDAETDPNPEKYASIAIDFQNVTVEKDSVEGQTYQIELEGISRAAQAGAGKIVATASAGQVKQGDVSTLVKLFDNTTFTLDGTTYRTKPAGAVLTATAATPGTVTKPELNAVQLTSNQADSISGSVSAQFHQAQPNTPAPGGSGSGSGSSRTEREQEYWDDVKADIKAASEGDVITISAKSWDRLPWTVMKLLGCLLYTSRCV